MEILILENTTQRYDVIIRRAKHIFLQKTEDYGTAWRILRPTSVTDQMYIKASRIRSIEEKGAHRVPEGVAVEYLGLINYGIMALIQLGLPNEEDVDMDMVSVEHLYDKYAVATRKLMLDKNHDYGEAWRELRLSSMTDLILMKLLRIRQIEANDGQTIISEGLDANFMDIINYAAFALIKLDEMAAREKNES